MPTKAETKYVTWVLYRNNSRVAPFESYSSGSFAYSRQRTGNPYPGWRNVIKSGGNATTAMDAKGSSLGLSPGSAFCTVPKGWSNPQTGQLEDIDEWVTGNGVLPSQGQLVLQKINPSKADNQALTRFYQAIRQTRSSFDGGSFVGEFAESVALLRNSVRRLDVFAQKALPKYLALQQKLTAKYLGSYAIGANGSAVRVRGWPDSRVKSRAIKQKFREQLADNWLEFSFGWRPLVRDVEEAAQALAEYHIQRDGQHRLEKMIRGYGVENQAINNQVSSGPVHMHINARIVTTTSASVEVIYRGKMVVSQWYDGPYDRMKSLSERFGFTLEQFVPTVWNLLPYSFLVDYFVNVGDFLMAATTDTSGLMWVSKTVIYKTTEIASSSAYSNVGSCSGHIGGYQQETREISRRPISILGYPSLEFSLPDTATRFANVLALLTGGNRYPRSM